MTENYWPQRTCHSSLKEKLGELDEEKARQQLVEGLERWMLVDYKKEQQIQQNARTIKGMRIERERRTRHYGNLLRDPSGMPLVPAVAIVPHQNFSEQLKKSSFSRTYLAKKKDSRKQNLTLVKGRTTSMDLTFEKHNKRNRTKQENLTTLSKDRSGGESSIPIRHRSLLREHPELALIPKEVSAISMFSPARWRDFSEDNSLQGGTTT